MKTRSNVYTVATMVMIWMVALVSGPAHAEDLKRIYIGEGVLARVTENGIAGPFPEILYEAARRVGTEIEIIPIAWKRGQTFAQEEPGAGAATVTRVPSRESLYVWIEDYMPLTLTFFVMKDSKLDPKSMEDLKGLSVGIELGSVADFVTKGLGDRGMHITLVPRPELVANMMRLDRVDGWLIWDIIGLENFRQQNMLNDVRRTFNYIVGPIYLVTNKSVSEANVEKWRKALAEMKADGFIQNTLIRHYGSLAAKNIQ